MTDAKKNLKKLTIAIIPFIFLILIGLIKGNITYHQKIYKTFMIFIFDLTLFIILAVHIFGNKQGIEKQKKYLLYFLGYFLFIFFQFVVSFLSKEIGYDREYYLANYTFLIIFSMSFFLFLKNLEEVKLGMLLINIFFVIVLVWSIRDFAASGGVLGKLRPKLSFGNTNYFAGYAIGVLPLALITPIVWFNKKKKLTQNWISIATLIVGILGIIPLFFTQTRAALFGCYIGIAIVLIPSFVLMIDRIPFKTRILIAILLIILFLVCPVLLLKYPPPIVSGIFGRLVKTLDNPTFFIRDRINGWKGGMGLFYAHPVFGAGLGTVYPASFKYIGKYFYFYSNSNSYKHSHNEYVEVLGEAGIFGLVIFVLLFGSVIVLLLKRAYSKKYLMHYRFISLGVSAGIISMLIQQVFSLTLRMSVTMTAYFFLLGLGIFLISYSKKALIVPEEKSSKKILPKYFYENLNKRETQILLAVVFLFIFVALFLFLPVFRSENNILKAIKSESMISREYYLKNAVEIKPDNPYAWTKKWEFENNVLNSYLSSGYMNKTNEKYFTEIKQDLDKINSIIPGYQDVWSKYASYYRLKNTYLDYKWEAEHNTKDLEDSKDSLKKASEYLDKSINTNFLNEYNHFLKLLILKEFDNKNQFNEAMKDYFIMRIYLDFGRRKKVVKEQIIIRFSEETKMEMIDGVYYFTLERNKIEELSNICFEVSDINNQKTLEQILRSESDRLLGSMFPLPKKKKRSQ